MHWLYPNVLYALSAIAIPILIHLIQLRKYRKVVFSDIRFIRAITQQENKQKNIKKWLILLLRIFVFICFVFVFAQPYWSTQKISGNGTHYTSVFLDNSPSMLAENKLGSSFEQARELTRNLVNSASDNDRFQLVTNEFNGKHQHWVPKKEMLTLIDELNIHPGFRTISEIYKRQVTSFENVPSNVAKSAYIISDFTKSQANQSIIPLDSQIQSVWIPVSSSNRNNIYIDSIWVTEPIMRTGTPIQLHFNLTNQSDDALNDFPIQLKIQDQIVHRLSIQCPPHMNYTGVISFQVNDTNWQKAELSFTDHPFTFDDHFYFTFKPANHLPILLIQPTNANPAISNALRTDPFFSCAQVDPQQLNYSQFSTVSCVIVNEVTEITSGMQAELIRFVANGGNLIFVPPATSTLSLSSQQFLESIAGLRYIETVQDKQSMRKINVGHPFFKSVFEKTPKQVEMPIVNSYFQLESTGKNAVLPLITLTDEKGVIFSGNYQKGKIWISAIPLDASWSNFTRNALFVPILLRQLILSGKSEAFYSILKPNIHFQLPGISEESVHIIQKNTDVIAGSVRTMEGIQYRVDAESLQPNVYNVTNNQGELVANWACNADQSESNTSLMSDTELQEMAKTVQAKIIRDEIQVFLKNKRLQEQGWPLWKYFLYLAIAGIIAEMVLIRPIRLK